MDMELSAINNDTNAYSSIIINRIFNGVVLIYKWLTRAVKNVLHGCGILMCEYVFYSSVIDDKQAVYLNMIYQGGRVINDRQQ